MVTRVRNNSYGVSATYTVHETYNGNVVAHYTGTLSAIALETMTDEPTPGFKRKSASGLIINKPMSKVSSLPVFNAFTQSVVTPSNNWSSTYLTEWPVSPAPLIKGYDVRTDPNVLAAIATNETLAITDAYAGVGAPDVAVLTELAELKETLAFLYSPVRAIVKLTQRFRDHVYRVDSITSAWGVAKKRWDQLPPSAQKKRAPPKKPKLPVFKAGKFSGSDIASAWLAYRYAVMPLVYTFEDVQRLLKKLAKGPSTRATSRAKENREVDLDYDSAWSAWLPYGGKTFRKRFVRTGTVTVTSRAGVLYEPSWDLLGMLGIQLNRVPAAAYEAIPLSFVADWAWNGSKVYDALTAEFRVQKILSAWVTTRVSYGMSGGQELEAGPGCTVTFTPSAYTDAGEWKTRRPASLQDVKIKFRPDLNAKRIADGLALIYTLLVSIRKKGVG